MINVIGIGQNRDNMTLGAIKAIEESDVIIGYKKYVDQIEDLIEGKEIVKKGMGDEIARAEFAIKKSQEGQTVSLISSGDPGVFGMANVLYQIVSKYDDVEIKVYPGVSALNYASSHLGDSTYEPPKATIVEVKDLTEDLVNMSCTLIVGNDITYVQDGKMITPRGYVIRSKIHPLSQNHYEKFLNGEVAHGPNRECEFYPCHWDGQYCDFCYCPFYPCGDSATGGEWIKGKGVWNCTNCHWLHQKETVEYIREPLENILEDVEDLKTKKKTLLKLRKSCLLKTDPNDL